MLPNAGVLSLDARGHGLTTQDPEPAVTDLALETLTSDLGFVVNATKSQMGWTDLPDIVLIGHSLGGAVTTDLAQSGHLGPKVLAYAVLDVVEGKAQTMVYSPNNRIDRSFTKGLPWTHLNLWKRISLHVRLGFHQLHLV